MTVPFIGKRFEFTQPDGTKIQALGWGDQYHAMFRTFDGHFIVRNRETRFYEYGTIGPANQLYLSGVRAGIDPAPIRPLASRPLSSFETKSLILSNPGMPRSTTRWRIRSERKRRMSQHVAMAGVSFAPPPRTTTGTFVGLCILIDFPDVPATIPEHEVDAYLNGTNYSGFDNAGSVREYFHDVSGGRVDYTSIVTPYITASNNRDYYTDETIDWPMRAHELIGEALSALQASGFDFTQLTVDDENYIYAINCFYAGPCVNNWSQGLWPHSSSLPSPVLVHPRFRANDYQFTDMDEKLTLGTFCHENGHMICDFPDLYDYGNDSAGAGRYCLMCYGGNPDPKNPTHVSAYLKYRAGWAESVRRLTPGMTCTIPASGNHFYVHSRNDQEYFILENRRNSGRDAALRSSGLAIWHVDELGKNDYQEATPAKHYECALMQADGLTELEYGFNDGDALDLFPNGGKTAFSDATVPGSRWWTGAISGLSLDNIRNTGTAVTFDT